MLRLRDLEALACSRLGLAGEADEALIAARRTYEQSRNRR
jgi:hypothetical protein